jgi:hypothetical protein
MVLFDKHNWLQWGSSRCCSLIRDWASCSLKRQCRRSCANTSLDCSFGDEIKACCCNWVAPCVYLHPRTPPCVSRGVSVGVSPIRSRFLHLFFCIQQRTSKANIRKPHCLVAVRFSRFYTSYVNPLFVQAAWKIYCNRSYHSIRRRVPLHVLGTVFLNRSNLSPVRNDNRFPLNDVEWEWNCWRNKIRLMSSCYFPNSSCDCLHEIQTELRLQAPRWRSCRL